MIRTRSTGQHFVVFMVALVWLGGCASLPDLSSYTSSTIRLQSAIDSSGQVVLASLNSAKKALEAAKATQAATYKKHAGDFERHWKARVAAMDALVAYARSLEEIAASGRSGSKSAKAVAGAVTSFAESLGVVPGGQIVGVATDAAAFVYGQIAIIRAARSLQESIDATTPVLERLVQVIDKDLDDARKAFVYASDATKKELRVDYGHTKKAWEVLVDRRRERLERLHLTLADEKVSVVSALNATEREELEEIERRLLAVEPEWLRYQTKLAAIQDREDAGMEIISASQTALQDWIHAQKDLAASAGQRRPARLDGLADAVVEIRSLVERWRNL
ncbi:MAG: hypothetical protein IH830_11765 [Planctomycetes bacterium]|nr:hypothetical protein [Planctomycetota bacterium]